MENEQLIEILKLQNEILETLCNKYVNDAHNPQEKEKMRELKINLKELSKNIK